MVRAVLAAFAATVLISGLAQAQSAVGSDTPALVEARSQLSASGRVSWYRGEYDACTEKPSTVEIVACIDDLTKAWDRRLNAAYGALMDGQTPEQKVRLHAAEREWLQFRNVNCDYYLNSGGTIANIRYAECRRVLTAQRAIELETAGRP